MANLQTWGTELTEAPLTFVSKLRRAIQLQKYATILKIIFLLEWNMTVRRQSKNVLPLLRQTSLPHSVIVIPEFCSFYNLSLLIKLIFFLRSSCKPINIICACLDATNSWQAYARSLVMALRVKFLSMRCRINEDRYLFRGLEVTVMEPN